VTVGPIPPAGTGAVPPPAPRGAEGTLPEGKEDFGRLVLQGLEAVSGAEREADALIQAMASGQPVQPHEVLIATSKAGLSVQMVVAIRDKALEAYQQVMNLQI
jgi:flagellar hook-basal body complex protein FliE